MAHGPTEHGAAGGTGAMSTVTEMADKLADECIAVQDEIGNDRLFMELGQVLGAS